ncbi:putative transcription factor interactor and regulator C3H-WRC/GRF family [Helianthus annuus]|nr:putative transcription factor interactor and regulator C3H-WRC/GRF family [Helianthus annuus]KAJ0649089.1 putative transcription factor interactor and regulator C3H-WRC/GRF family [Helianthus annuus]KAJ0845219.1 putative transcription factor interactor and regulator C3H-WRC/GRF family [Helianthus annuus]
MAESGGDLPDDQRCKRNDGRQWRCRRPVVEGRTLCEAHFLQGKLRQNNEPVPESLKIERQRPRKNRKNQENQQNPSGRTEIRGIENMGSSSLPRKRVKTEGESSSSSVRKRRKRNVKEGNLKSTVDISEDLDDALKKMNLKKGDLQLDLIRGYLNRQIEKKKGKQPHKEDIVKELKYGRLEISQASPSTPPVTVNNVKVGASASGSLPTRFFRSKNIDRIPVATMQNLPNIKATAKAATKKCHWCRMCSYRVLVKCLNCKKHLFCEDCIRARSHDKAEVKKQCPVCNGTCSCRGCERGKSKEVKTKDLVVYNGEGKFDKSRQLLYMIHLLLPLIEQINQEKYDEMDIEAKDRTKDLEKSAKEIVYDHKFTNVFDFDSLHCGLCDVNDKIEGENEGEISTNNKSLYFSIKQDLGDKNVEHFTKHWVKGQPLIIRDVIKSDTELSWDPIFTFFTYLDRSVKSRNDKEVKLKNCLDWCEVEMGRQQIFMGGKTHANVWNEKLKFKVWLSSGIFQEHFPSHYAAVMHALPLQEYTNPLMGVLNLAANVPPESQNVDLGPFVYISYGRPEDLIRSDFLTKLCYHAYDMVNILVHATELTISEKKLGKVKVLLNKYGSQDHNESLRKNKNKIDEACGKSSFSSEVTQQSELEDIANGELTQTPNVGDACVFSDDDSSNCDSDDEDLCDDEYGSSGGNEGKVVDTCGAHWDVFRREDVDKLVEFLRKYSDELNSSHCSPKKVVHPILDESFYLDAFHKKYLKEEYDVEPWTFEQHIGEAVIIPAGCPYQVKKIKSCVNVVFESVSPESASMCIKLSDEIRQLPVNHKAKGKMLDVKKMTIRSVNAAVEEIRNVSHEVEEIHKVPQAESSDKDE